MRASSEAWERGYFFSPTVIEARDPANYAMQHEIFGPVLCLSAFSGRNREQALGNAVRLMNESRYGLSNAMLTNDRSRQWAGSPSLAFRAAISSSSATARGSHSPRSAWRYRSES